MLCIQCHFTSVCFDNYIIQGTTSIIDRLAEPLPQVYHDILGLLTLSVFPKFVVDVVHACFQVSPEKEVAWR